MITVTIIATGLSLLLVAGIYQLSAARLSGVEVKGGQLVSEESTTFTRSDLTDPTRILGDRDKLRSATIIVLEVAAIVMSVWMSIYVYAMPGVSTPMKLLVFAALAVGALLVGRGLYVRLGLYQPLTLRESLQARTTPGVAEDFASIRDALDTARSSEGVDEVAVGVLAAAKNGSSIDGLKKWGRAENLADSETFEDRVGTLADAGIVRVEEGQLALETSFEDVEDDQLATVVDSVLN